MNRKLNIALISPSKNSYSETFIQMHKSGIKGNIIYYYNGDIPTCNDLEGVYLNKFKKKIFKLKKRINLTQLSIKEQALLASFKKNKIDIVVAEYGTTAAAVFNTCSHNNIPLLPIFHGFDASISEVIENNKTKYLKVFDYSKIIVVVSNKIAETIINLGCPKNKIVVTPCAPNSKFFNNKPNYNKPVFITVGRFVEKKAPYYTILSFIKVLKKHPNAELHFIGDGPLKNICIDLINYYAVNNNIKIHGIINSDQIHTYFENAYGFIQHSIIAKNGDSEGTPVSILEASAAALPVVSTKHGGILDVILDNNTGFLVEEHNVDFMSEKICELLENKNLAKQMGERGRDYVLKNFSYDIHLNLINKAIQDSLW